MRIFLQYKNYKRHRTVPPELTDVMTEEELNKARSYAIDKMRYNEIHTIFNEVETTVTNFLSTDHFVAYALFPIDSLARRCFTMGMEKIR